MCGEGDVRVVGRTDASVLKRREVAGRRLQVAKSGGGVDGNGREEGRVARIGR